MRWRRQGAEARRGASSRGYTFKVTGRHSLTQAERKLYPVMSSMRRIMTAVSHFGTTRRAVPKAFLAIAASGSRTFGSTDIGNDVPGVLNVTLPHRSRRQ